MDRKYKIYSLILMLSVIVLLSVSFARAEDDEEDRGEDEHQTQTQQTSEKSGAEDVKMITQTIILEPAKVVTTTIMKNFDLPDSDRDGIADEQDLYPQIPQQLIVEDYNFDGIDDRYEVQE